MAARAFVGSMAKPFDARRDQTSSMSLYYPTDNDGQGRKLSVGE
jgi:hypothetical protein